MWISFASSLSVAGIGLRAIATYMAARAGGTTGVLATAKVLSEHGQEAVEMLEAFISPAGQPTFRGAHVLNKGKPNGTCDQVKSIQKEGLREGNAHLGRGVYTHYVEDVEKYSHKPHIIFEAHQTPNVNVEHVKQLGNIKFMKITTGGTVFNEVNLPVKILQAKNLDHPWHE